MAMTDPLDEGLVFEVRAGALGEAAVDVALLAALSLVPRALLDRFAFRWSGNAWSPERFR